MIGFAESKEANFCYLLGDIDVTPIFNYVQNTSNEIFAAINNGTFQLEIGADCGANLCIYGVNDDGSLDCRACSGGGAGGNETWLNGSAFIYPNATFSVNVNTTGWVNASGIYINEMSVAYWTNNTLTSTYNATYHAGLGVDQVNTTEEIFEAVDNETFMKYVDTIPYTNLTAVFNISYAYWTNNTLTDTYNVTYHEGYVTITNGTFQIGTEQVNTTEEMFAAINNETFIPWADSIPFGNLTAVFNASYAYWTNNTLTSTYNVTYHAGLAVDQVNTTEEMFAAVDNETFHKYSEQITWSNISDPLTWNATYHEGYVTITNGTFQTGTEQVNTTEEIFGVCSNETFIPWIDTIPFENITAIFNATYELTFNATYDAKPDTTFNTTYDAKPDTAFNSSYEYWTNNTLTTAQNQTYDVTGWMNTTAGFNTTDRVITGLICFNVACSSNITYNGTNIIIYG